LLTDKGLNRHCLIWFPTGSNTIGHRDNFTFLGPQDYDIIRLRITDTGEGIPEEKQRRVFSPFDRLEAEKTETEGTGLVLALTKSLIEGMGGKIGLESQVGYGTTFWVELKSGDAPQKDKLSFISDQI